jgi:hypothetical protein
VEHRFTLPGTSAPEVVVEHRFMHLPEVRVEGREIERRTERGRPYWPIPMPDGGERRLFIRGSITGLQGAVDGQLIRIERKLAMWELILALLPFSLVGLGLAGGFAGFAASAVNLKLVREPWSAPVRAGVMVVVFAVALVVALVLVRLTAR